jgi:hypothetical protein
LHAGSDGSTKGMQMPSPRPRTALAPSLQVQPAPQATRYAAGAAQSIVTLVTVVTAQKLPGEITRAQP